jgi:uncharacterized membrane protein YuzA (DUF378 family)
MMVNLYNVLTVIAVVWLAVIVLTMILGDDGDDFATIIYIIVSMASVGLILYRLGEFMKLLVGG